MKNTTMLIVKAKAKEVICKCGGDVMVDASMTYVIPVGIGFHPDGHCYIDSMHYTGWKGVCLDCQKEVFGWKTSKLISKRVKNT